RRRLLQPGPPARVSAPGGVAMRRARFVRVALLAALTGVLCLPMTAPAQKRGGTLVMLVQPEPPTLASYISTSGPIGQVATKVYEGLLEYDFNLKPIPSLAESWKVSADGKTITFVLQKGVRFHDGKPFTSADVKFSRSEERRVGKGCRARRSRDRGNENEAERRDDSINGIERSRSNCDD